MAEFSPSQAIAGAALGFASGASGRDFLSPYLATLAERRKTSKRRGAQYDILRGQTAGNPELKEFWDNQLLGATGEGEEPLTIDEKFEIVAGYDAREFDAMHSEAIRFLADKGRDAEKQEDRDRLNSAALRELETQFVALGRPIPARGDDEADEDYIGRLRGQANADSIGYARGAAALDEYQEERETFLSDLDKVDPQDWMSGDTAIVFGNRAQTLVGDATRELGGYFPGQAAGFGQPILAAVERKSEEARLFALQERIAAGDYTNDALPPVFADGARKTGRRDTYSETDYRRAGLNQVLQQTAPIYDSLRQLVRDGVEATPELADARQYLVTNELSQKAFANLPFEQKREVAELLRGVTPDAIAGAKQFDDNRRSRVLHEDRFAKALVAAGVQDPQRVAGVIADQRLYQIGRGSPDSPLKVEVYQGLAPEGVERLADLMPKEVGLATAATAWANRVATAGELTADQRETLIRRAVEKATATRDRGALVGIARDLEQQPDIERQRGIIGEIVSVSMGEAQTLSFQQAFQAVGRYVDPPTAATVSGISGIPFAPRIPTSEAGRRAWMQRALAAAPGIRERLLAIPEAKGDRAGRAQALAALDAIEQSPESMIVRKAGAPDLRGPSERLIESVVAGLDQDAVNVRTREIARALSEVEAARKSGTVDEASLTEEEAALRLEQEEIGLMQQAGLSSETRRGVLRSLVQFSGDPDTDWEEQIQDIGASFGGFDPAQSLPAWAGDAVSSLKKAGSPTERIIILRDLAAKNPDLFYKASAVPGSGAAGLLVSRAFRGDLDEILAAAADLAESGAVGGKGEMEKKWAVSLPSDYDGQSMQDKALMLLAAGLSARPLTGKPRPAQTEGAGAR